MRFHFGIRSFSVDLSNGRRTQYTYRCLLPFIAVPIVLIVALLFLERDVLRYLRRSTTDSTQLRNAWDTFAHVNTSAAKNLVGSTPVSIDSDLPTLQLFVPKNTLDEMQSALVSGDPKLGRQPGGNKPYFKATLIDDDRRQLECKVALRGWGFWHHRPEKPSFRVRLRKTDVRAGRRFYELQRPEDALALKNWIPIKLGEKLGLLSDFSEHVRLFVNKKYFGVYLRTMRQNERMAVANGRMPGTFFKGDLSGNLWSTSDNWRVFGDMAEENIAHFDRFLATLREEPSANTLESLHVLLDAEVYAKWAALMIVTGSTHTDHSHNQSFFLTSNQGKLEAIPWDCNSYGMHFGPDVPPDTIQHPIMNMISRDPRWVHRRNQIVYELLSTVALPENIHRLIDETIDRLLPDLRSDVHLSSLQYTDLGNQLVPWSVLDIDRKRAEIKQWAQARYDFLMDYLSSSEISVKRSIETPGWSRITVAGHVAVRVSRADAASHDSNVPDDNPTILYPGLSESLQDFSTRPETGLKHTVQIASVAQLEYIIQGQPEDLHFFNAITGSEVFPSTTSIASVEPERTVHPDEFANKKTATVTLGPGEVTLAENLYTESSQTLIIQPGTQLYLGPGVGIYAQGRVIAEGSPQEIIRIGRASDMPWGAIGISGSQTRGSRFRHVHVSGGSIGSDGGIRFKGMFNVYDCPDVIIRDCFFGRNDIGDDSVNVAESRVAIVDTVFADARADGLDLDLCHAEVIRCRWQNAGNDCADVMGGRATFSDCTMEGAGDKGISVGEKSAVIVQDSRFKNCNIGIEVKDDSQVLVQDSLLEHNEVAVSAYQKKWFYGKGGSIALVESRIVDSLQNDFVIEKRSEAILLNTQATEIGEEESRVRIVRELDSAWADLMRISGQSHVE